MSGPNYKADFPLLLRSPRVHYLDSAATTQRPAPVLERVMHYHTHLNGNAGRGSHELAVESALLIENTRKKTAQFINAAPTHDIVFTKSCTESLNIIAHCYALPRLRAGDEIVLAISNHHANIVPWQHVCRCTGATIQWLYPDAEGNLDIQEAQKKIRACTKIVSFSAVVNATGAVNPAQELTALAHQVGAVVVIDGAQAMVHGVPNVADLGCDFFVFSGHKMFSLFGVGVLCAPHTLLESMPPFLYGGGMVDFVTEQESVFKGAPHKYEGGSANTAAVVSLCAAIEYCESLESSAVRASVHALDAALLARLEELPFLETYHARARERLGIIAFNVKNVHSHDTAHILGEEGVMVRSGDHCSKPFMTHLSIQSCCRASFCIYNTMEDVEALTRALHAVGRIFQCS
ncbi:cysteine desulfurase [Treponema pallidum]|uniref:Probable cysteine desulfurase n=4 Tax=Treponema pallidum TaxID=160 RepID=CSD_TREPA|nr:SufS family cysteine desulfurase [Treponema pallidum]O83623.1 RecName: Full=Probable cysteine desulfurase [Treponema pallidum subsp. pallidum str. Nichols]AAC65590.1 nitrogen fixation protein (nifS-1) [Treponema pallidum subsp. pallidum str. Nichols]ACD71033.1 nitrogen fixation protein [Treponema pallidum subsp. pallidum SS14]ADD72721.1 cysteine desulfurase [Treponema pallidum subsp. pallidum str. Chicago]AEZ57738.1 bifunctional cysteine desulfurase/ selenocysteine lyase [Treponema pallidum